MKAIINIKLYDYVTWIENGFLLYDEKIEAIGCMDDFPGAEEIKDGKGMWLIPGLINFHTHHYSTFARGFDFKVSPQTFTETLEDIWWRLDKVLDLEDLYQASLIASKLSLEKGVVAIIDHNASGVIHGSLQAVDAGMKKAGLHGNTCFEISDRMNVQAAIDENIKGLKDQGLYYGLHASMTLSDASLDLIKRHVDQKPMPIHVHVSESIDDHEAYDKSPIERLYEKGLLTEDSLLVHGVHLKPEDYIKIKDTQGKMVLALRSNGNNGVGFMDLSQLIKHDIPFLAGTDGLGFDVAKAWQWIYFHGQGSDHPVTLGHMQRAIIASYDYYQKMTHRKLGRFIKGYELDALLIDSKVFTPIYKDQVFSHLFFGVFDDLNLDTLWIGGRKYIEDKKCLDEFDWTTGHGNRVHKKLGGI